MVWEAASMDFIVGLPPSFGYTAIMVVVDRLSKYAHFGALKGGFGAPTVARLFVDTVVKLHGFPKKLLSDRDPIFMSTFWDELLSLSGTKLQFTTAYHPQTDGQSEVTNRALEQYLRAFVFDRPKRWFALLPWAELALNCSVNASIGMSPFQALYGHEPPSLFYTYPRPSHNTEVAELLAEREETLRTLKLRIQRSQLSMAEFANRKRKDVEFKVGDSVLLRLQPYRQKSVGKPLSNKLSRRFYGPYEILERIGKVAYRLRLPADSKIHNVFHVSLLKEFIPGSSLGVPLPPDFNRGRPRDTPLEATRRRTVLVDKLPQVQWLVRWSSDAEGVASWEPEDLLRSHFPHLRLEDKGALIWGGGGVDTTTTEEIEDTNMDELHEPMQPMQRESTPSTEATNARTTDITDTRGIKQARPKRIVSRPAKYGDFVQY